MQELAALAVFFDNDLLDFINLVIIGGCLLFFVYLLLFLLLIFVFVCCIFFPMLTRLSSVFSCGFLCLWGCSLLLVLLSVSSTTLTALAVLFHNDLLDFRNLVIMSNLPG